MNRRTRGQRYSEADSVMMLALQDPVLACRHSGGCVSITSLLALEMKGEGTGVSNLQLIPRQAKIRS